MKPIQFILIPAAVGIIILIFSFGRIKFTPDSEGTLKNMPKPVMSSSPAAEGFDHVLKMATTQVSAAMKDSINHLTADEQKASGEQREKQCKELSAMWARTGNFICAAHYLKEAADINGSVANWKDAGNALLYSFGGAADTVAKTYAITEAINCFEHVVKADTNDTKSKIQLALCYIDGIGGSGTMNGVLLLKDVERKDPDNEIMNLTLGRLAVVSGQFDKAISRLERLTKAHPDNADGYYYLAQAYRASGRKDDAIKTLEKCKSLMSTTPEAVKQIDQLINDIKKS